MNPETPPIPPPGGHWWSRRAPGETRGGAGGAGRGPGAERAGWVSGAVLEMKRLWRMAGRCGWSVRAALVWAAVWGVAAVAEWALVRAGWVRSGGGAGFDAGIGAGAGPGAEIGAGAGAGMWDVFSVAMVWSLAVAVAAVLPMWAYALAGLWLGWYGVNLMGAWAGTPVVVLPVAWWLAVGWWVWRRDRKKWRESACRLRPVVDDAGGTACVAGMDQIRQIGQIGQIRQIRQITSPSELSGRDTSPEATGPARSVLETTLWNVERGIFGVMLAWAGLLLAEPSGLGRVLGAGSVAYFGVLILILLPLGAVGVWAMKQWGTGARLDSAGWLDRVDFGKIWLGGLGVMGLGLGLSLWRSRSLTAGWVGSVADMAGTWTGLLWFWLGCGFGLAVLSGLLDSDRNRLRLLALGRTGWTLPVAWLGITAVEWILAHHPELFAKMGVPTGISNWLQGAESLRARLIFEAHAWVGVVILVLGLGFLWQGRVTVRLLPRLQLVWVTAFLGIWAGSDGLLEAFLDSGAAGTLLLPEGGEGSAGRLVFFGGGGLIFILVGGLCWWVGRVVLERSLSGEGRLAGRVGALALACGWLSLTGVPAGTGAGQCAEAALLGMVHFALPMILIWKWNRKSPVGAGLGMGLQAALGLAGLYMTLPWLERDPGDITQLGLLPVEWAVALFLLKWRRPGLPASGGALAGMLLASAGVAGWMQPGLFFPEVPLFSALNPPLHVGSAEGGWGDRDFFGSAHFALLMLMAAAGAVLGALIFRKPEVPGAPLLPLILRPIPPPVPPSA